ncbi:O-fucosyltransferase family protein [Klebsormidium nitens]|uniref:O-fucosyltransferase family protein n=1 Tax=Klebsormidium nitens TaxID=105231 RepID=A0A1Y1IB61_KLENI|nr:O-fucosyltransferase family protein [Klebsormidium nitens]|eukprot:GAQ86361.1 O-fucosyltransferase family protein [Klebsormidium nitens]
MLFILTLGPGLPTLEWPSDQQTTPHNREPLHRKLARVALASQKEESGSGGGSVVKEPGGVLPPHEAAGQHGTNPGVNLDFSFEPEDDAQNGDSEEEHQEFFQGEDGENDLEVLKNGVPAVDATGPPGEPIIMYPNLITVREEYITAKQEDPLLTVSAKALWEDPLQMVGEMSSCKEADKAVSGPVDFSSGFLLVDANGGLNQQRISVCNAVAVARLLNATLVVPRFLFDSVWLDGSQFQNIFDLDHFARTLAPDVRVVLAAPVGAWSPDQEKEHSLVVPKYSPPEFYLEHGAPLLKQHGVLKLAGYMHGLGFQGVPQELQRLRCRANYEALRLAPGLQAFADLLVERMRAQSGGRFLALHLRFEKDMVADTCCDYGGGEEERADLAAYRAEHFPGMAVKYGEMTDADVLRKKGHCPLTPEELGLLLAGMGYDNETVVYIAAGEVYGGARRMAVFEKLFPRSFTKRSLASAEELAPFAAHTSQLAALDTYVAVQSDVFAYGHTGSNFPKIVSGLRLYSGQRRTIAPYKKKLAVLFERARTEQVSWSEFSQQVRKMHPARKVSKEFGKNLYREPIPDCTCQLGTDVV